MNQTEKEIMDILALLAWLRCASGISTPEKEIATMKSLMKSEEIVGVK